MSDMPRKAANGAITARPEVLALIPALGGGKSVTHHNLLQVDGRPVIAYSIQHALDCPSITRTIVSTDVEEIAEAAWDAGAEVPFRCPADLANAPATELSVFRHALEWLSEKEGYRPELVVHLRPRTAVRDPMRIHQAVQQMLSCSEADALRSVGPAQQTPYRMWVKENDRLQPLLELPGVRESHSMPLRELPVVYWQNGYVDIVRPSTVLSLGSMVGRHVLAFVIDDALADLDYPEQIPELQRAAARAQAGTLFRQDSHVREDPSKRYPA